MAHVPLQDIEALGSKEGFKYKGREEHRVWGDRKLTVW